jgi:hypothetical protein
MEKVTVGSLKKFLKDIPDDLIVILSKDGEGNLFSPMSRDISLGEYEPENESFGDFNFDEKSPSAIVIFPIG